MTEQVRRFGGKAFLLAAVVVAMVWLGVAQRARIAESLGLLAHADWWGIAAAIVAQSVFAAIAGFAASRSACSASAA